MTSPLHYLEPYSLRLHNDVRFIYCIDTHTYDRYVYVSLGHSNGMFSIVATGAGTDMVKYYYNETRPSMISFYKYKHELKELLSSKVYKRVLMNGSYDNRGSEYD